MVPEKPKKRKSVKENELLNHHQTVAVKDSPFAKSPSKSCCEGQSIC
jgi:hypothetical protein